MQIKRIVCGPLSVNTYIASKEGSSDCVVIDPGDAAPILQYLLDSGLHCTDILLTHGHFDHIYGVHDLKQVTGARVSIHECDAPMLESSTDSLAAILGYVVEPVPTDVRLQDGDILEAAGMTFRVLHTPGHSQGCVCYLEEQERLAFCGDIVFFESVGRADFSHSDPQMLKESIRTKIYTLSAETELYPGHGGKTSVDHESKYNPFVRP